MSRQPRRFIILGAGGHGKVVADAIRACGDIVVGFIDQASDKVGRVVEPGGATVLRTQSDFLAELTSGDEELDYDSLALGIGNNDVRLELLSRIGADWFPPIIHPRASVSQSAQIGAATVIFANATINPAARVGDGVIINTGAVVEHDCHIGNASHLSPNATVCGGSKVGNRSWIGAGSTVIHQVSIGNNAIIGAGSVVIRDIQNDCTAVGNPARILKSNS